MAGTIVSIQHNTQRGGRRAAGHAARSGGGVWVRRREPGMTDMQYQMRNWYHFVRLSGDFNVEQFV